MNVQGLKMNELETLAKKKLVFHFYIPQNWETHPIVHLHLKLLRHYSYYFNEMLIVIAVNDASDRKTIERVEEVIVRNCTGHIELKVIKNDPVLREAVTCHDDFVMEIENYDGVLYFGHSKGIRNVDDGYDYTNICRWVCALYYQLCDYHSFYTLCTDLNALSTGALLTEIQFDVPVDTNHTWYYMGSFIGVMCTKFLRYCKLFKKDFKTPLGDRFYAEFYLPYIHNKEFCVVQNNLYRIGQCDVYHNIDEHLTTIFNNEEMDKFNNFANLIENESVVIY